MKATPRKQNAEVFLFRRMVDAHITSEFGEAINKPPTPKGV